MGVILNALGSILCDNTILLFLNMCEDPTLKIQKTKKTRYYIKSVVYMCWGFVGIGSASASPGAVR